MDPRLPFWVAAGLSFANALYGWLILPESLPLERRSPLRWKSANPIGALHLLRSNRVLAGLSMANFFGATGACRAALDLRAVCDLSLWLGHDDRRRDAGHGRRLRDGGAGRRRRADRQAARRTAGAAARAACGAIGFFIFGAAPTGPLFWLGIPVMALWGVAGAAIQALMTQLVAPDQQGQLQGATNSVNSVSQMLGPFLFTLTFAYFIGDQAPLKMPGAPFLLASALLVLALVIAWRTLSTAPVGEGAGP